MEADNRPSMGVSEVSGKPAGPSYEFTTDSWNVPSDFEEIVWMDTSHRSMEIPNAGGSSNISEALSMEYLHAKYGAECFVPEMEVVYWIESCLCDFLMVLPGENIGVSVTRAISYPFGVKGHSEYTIERARELLNRKLYKLLVARNAISEEQSFYRSILHVWCYDEQTAACIKRAHEEMVEADVDLTYNDVHVICTVCDTEYIYTNRPSNRARIVDV